MSLIAYLETLAQKHRFSLDRAATTPADLEARLAEARAELSGSEYLGLRGSCPAPRMLETEQEPPR